MRIKASVVRGRSSCYWDWARFAAVVVAAAVVAVADVDCDDCGVSHCLGVVVYSRLAINSNDTFDFVKVSLFAAVVAVDDALDFDLNALVDCYSCRFEEDCCCYCIVDRIKANMTMVRPLRATVLRESMWAKVAEATDYS